MGRKESERDRETDRDIYRQTDRWTNRQRRARNKVCLPVIY